MTTTTYETTEAPTPRNEVVEIDEAIRRWDAGTLRDCDVKQHSEDTRLTGVASYFVFLTTTHAKLHEIVALTGVSNEGTLARFLNEAKQNPQGSNETGWGLRGGNAEAPKGFYQLCFVSGEAKITKRVVSYEKVADYADRGLISVWRQGQPLWLPMHRYDDFFGAPTTG